MVHSDLAASQNISMGVNLMEFQLKSNSFTKMSQMQFYSKCREVAFLGKNDISKLP